MTKTICDICGNEMPTSKMADSIVDMNFCISSQGKIWDVCTQCRISLKNWMDMRKTRSEVKPNE